MSDPNDASAPIELIVRACKFDGTENRRWNARLIERVGTLLVLDATFDSDIEHDLLGQIASGTLSTEYYWTDRWYNIFRFSDPSGVLRNYYCNVNMPPELNGNFLSYIDLDVDILVAPDRSYRILDEDEFATNAAHFGYPEDVRRNVDDAVQELVEMIETGQFPFDR
jgi:protein associated with RNAse G/E